jgi:hypothetical protein
LETLNDELYVLGAVAGADEDGVFGFDYDEVADADEGDCATVGVDQVAAAVGRQDSA